MATYTEVWKCCECGEIHDDDDDAQECCKPRIEELYRCDVCSETHEDEDEAGNCCGLSSGYTKCPSCYRHYRSNELSASAVEIAGHCQTCNPLFTIYQQVQIEDRHLELTGKHGDLARE